MEGRCARGGVSRTAGGRLSPLRPAAAVDGNPVARPPPPPTLHQTLIGTRGRGSPRLPVIILKELSLPAAFPPESFFVNWTHRPALIIRIFVGQPRRSRNPITGRLTALRRGKEGGGRTPVARVASRRRICTDTARGQSYVFNAITFAETTRFRPRRTREETIHLHDKSQRQTRVTLFATLFMAVRLGSRSTKSIAVHCGFGTKRHYLGRFRFRVNHGARLRCALPLEYYIIIGDAAEGK